MAVCKKCGKSPCKCKMGAMPKNGAPPAPIPSMNKSGKVPK